jgi:hypothetical protein
MRRSKLMVVVAVIGLALGVPLALEGWWGLRGVLIFLEEQGPRLLGGILVGLSIAVLIRQARSRSVAPLPPPKVTPSSDGAAQGASAISHPESPPAPHPLALARTGGCGTVLGH